MWSASDCSNPLIQAHRTCHRRRPSRAINPRNSRTAHCTTSPTFQGAISVVRGSFGKFSTKINQRDAVIRYPEHLWGFYQEATSIAPRTAFLAEVDNNYHPSVPRSLGVEQSSLLGWWRMR